MPIAVHRDLNRRVTEVRLHRLGVGVFSDQQCSVYTPMTRGRNANHAYVVTDENRTAVDVLTQAIGRDWIDRPATTRRIELETRHQDPPMWPSLQTHQHRGPDASSEPELGREPVHADGAGDDRSAEGEYVERLVEQQLRAIEQRRIDRNLNRSDLGIGR